MNELNDAGSDAFEAVKALSSAAPVGTDADALVAALVALDVNLRRFTDLGIHPRDVVAYVEKWGVSVVRHGKERHA